MNDTKARGTTKPDPYTEPEMDAVAARIFELVNYYARGRQVRFAELTGVNRASLSQMKRKGTAPSAGTLQTILLALPDVSSRWLLLGEGPMLDPHR